MASITIKVTYSLDVPTVRSLERLARLWKVSKSEALRRAIRLAAERDADVETDPVRALDRLQDEFGLDQAEAERWEKDVRAGRRASSRRLEGRRR